MRDQDWHHKEEYIILGEKIKFVRENLGLSQRAFASSLGISHAALCNYEHNDREATFSLILKIVKIYNIDIYLFASEKVFESYQLDIKALNREVSTTFIEVCDDIELCLHKISLCWQGVPSIFNEHIKTLHQILIDTDVQALNKLSRQNTFSQEDVFCIIQSMLKVHDLCTSIATICKDSEIFLHQMNCTQSEVLKLLEDSINKINYIEDLYK